MPYSAKTQTERLLRLLLLWDCALPSDTGRKEQKYWNLKYVLENQTNINNFHLELLKRYGINAGTFFL